MAYINAYKDVKLKKWSNVLTEYIRLTGYVLGPQCAEDARLKIRGLKEKYRRLMKHNCTSGNSPKPVPELMEDAFGADTCLVTQVVESCKILFIFS